MSRRLSACDAEVSVPVVTTLVKFGVFEFDLATGDLFNGRRTIRLQEQPRQVLATLLARPGEIVTREDLKALLWSDDTFVDFDAGLNVVVNKIRHALGDSASSPRFVETLPRRGYRVIAPVAPVGGAVAATAGEPAPDRSGAEAPASSPADVRPPAVATRVWPFALVTVLLIAALGFWVAAGRRAVEGRASGDRRIKTLAVLPLENLSRDIDNDYFSDGMTDALITELASIHSLNVIARQSTRQFKGSTKSVAAIAKELGGVDAVIEGSVVRTANRVRLIVQLIDARTERHLWAQTYERELTDVLQLQRDVALTVSSEIRDLGFPLARHDLSLRSRGGR